MCYVAITINSTGIIHIICIDLFMYFNRYIYIYTSKVV